MKLDHYLFHALILVAVQHLLAEEVVDAQENGAKSKRGWHPLLKNTSVAQHHLSDVLALRVVSFLFFHAVIPNLQ